jgi:integrase
MSLSVTESLKAWAKTIEVPRSAHRRMAARMGLSQASMSPNAPTTSAKRLSTAQVLVLLKKTDPGSVVQPWHAWAPRLALYQGLRAHEIAVLRTDHLICEEGRWHLRLGQNPDTTVARRTARTIPLVRALEDDGFVTFVREHRDLHGHGPLFDALAEARRPGDAIHTWMRKQGRNLTVPEQPLASMDSLRTAFVTSMVLSGARDHHLTAFLGLAPRPSVMDQSGWHEGTQKAAFLGMADRAAFPWLSTPEQGDSDHG